MEPVLYVGDRIRVSRTFAEMVLTMLPPGYEEVLVVDGVHEGPDGIKMLRVRTLERRVVGLQRDTEAP